MRNSILLLCIIVLSLSCKKEEPAEDPTGSAFVTVMHNYQVIPGSQVSTEPSTRTVSTDLTGSAIISNIPIGGYKVNAFHPEIGTGSASITVTANAAADVIIHLIAGVFENPSVDIQSPVDYSIHNYGEEVHFSAMVNDPQEAPNTLSIEWSSDKDGILNSEPADVNGIASFSISSLSQGEHVISIKVTDSDGFESMDHININVKVLPEAVNLDPIELTTGGLSLSWSVSTEPDFYNYRVLRSENLSGPFDVIEIISDLNTVNYTDINVSFGVRYFYQITVVLNNGDESFSNIESQLFEGENIDVGVSIVRMIIDPVRPYIYALDQINNSLLFINTNTRTVEKTIFVGSIPSDIDINLENTKAYVANFGSTQIAVIDLELQEKVDDLFVNTQSGVWDGNPYRLACLSDNKIVFTSEDQWNNLKLIDATNGSSLSTTGSVYQPGLLTNSAGTVVFVTESGSSGSATLRYNLTGDELQHVDESEGGSSYGHRDGCISGNDIFIFHRRIKYLTNNLNSELGTFTENIIECNHDGSIAIGVENIWDAETFSILKPLPITSSIIRLDKDGNTIYIYDSSTSKIYITTIN